MSEPVLVTGAAGFIGMHVCISLLRSGIDVVGLDSLGPGHLQGLEQLRRDRLQEIERQVSLPGLPLRPGKFQFIQLDIADPGFVSALAKVRFDRIVHLAAQAGVRYSIDRPDVYVRSNLVGMANMLELARARQCPHLVFASSSSVYGGRLKTPFAENDRIDRPVSFYAATKVANEAMAASYSQLFDLPITGLRFFTVYGPWGRPDMAPWLFAESILRGLPIKVFGRGELLRDFTYVDDITEGICRVLDKPPQIKKTAAEEGQPSPSSVPGDIARTIAPCESLAIYNIGNNRPTTVNDFIGTLERLLGRQAIRNEMPIQPGDVPVTCASIERLHAATGFAPVTSLNAGLTAFCGWFRDYRRL